jgi:hypothetical protein
MLVLIRYPIKKEKERKTDLAEEFNPSMPYTVPDTRGI